MRRLYSKVHIHRTQALLIVFLWTNLKHSTFVRVYYSQHRLNVIKMNNRVSFSSLRYIRHFVIAAFFSCNVYRAYKVNFFFEIYDDRPHALYNIRLKFLMKSFPEKRECMDIFLMLYALHYKRWNRKFVPIFFFEFTNFKIWEKFNWRSCGFR